MKPANVLFRKVWALLPMLLLCAIAYSQTPITVVTNCSTTTDNVICEPLVQYNLTLEGSESATGNIEVVLTFGNPSAASSFLLVSPPSGVSAAISGSEVRVQIALSSPSSDLVIPYTIHAGCALIPVSNPAGLNITVELDVAASTSTPGTIALTVPSHNKCPLFYPYITNVGPTTVTTPVIDQNITYSFVKKYRNAGNAEFNGSIKLNGSFNCENLLENPSVSNEGYIVEIYNSSNVLVGTPVTLTDFDDPLDNVTVPAGGSIEVTIEIKAISCISGDRCDAEYTLDWGCDNDICRQTSTTTLVIPSNVKPPRIYVNRISPVGAPIDAWDNSYGGTETEWSFLVYNGGDGPANFVTFWLNNPSTRSLTLIDAGIDAADIEILAPNHTDFSGMFPGISAPTNLSSATKSTVALNPSIHQASVTCASGLTNPIQRFEIGTVSDALIIGPNEGFIVRFKTLKCCESDLDYANMKSMGVDFNHWELGVEFDRDCDERRFGGIPTVASGNPFTLSPVNGFTDDNPNAISTHSISDEGDLYLNQLLLRNDNNLVGGTQIPGGPKVCGAWKTFQIRNAEFPNTSTNTTSEDVQMFAPSYTSVPAGILRVEIVLPADIKVRTGVKPTIVGGTITWEAASWAWDGLTNIAIADFDLASNWTGGAPLTGEEFRDFLQPSVLNWDMQACCAADPVEIVTVNTQFSSNPYGSISHCFIKLSQLEIPISIQCPGCNTPGPIVEYGSILRKTIGFPDFDDDGLPEVDAQGNLVTIDLANYSKTANLNREGSIVGDEVVAHCFTRFQDGAPYSVNSDGFSLADWNDNVTGCYPGATLKYLLYESAITYAGDVGLTPVGNAPNTGLLELEYIDNSVAPGITRTITFTNCPVFINTNGSATIYSYIIKLDDSNVNITPRIGDWFNVKAHYKICTNPTELVTLQAMDNVLLSATYPNPGSNNQPRTHYPELGNYFPPLNERCAVNPYSVSMGDQPLWLCSGLMSTHDVYPVVARISEKSLLRSTNKQTPNNITCAKPGVLEIEYFIDGSGVENIFPYEYRLVPGIANNAINLGPTTAQGPISFRINVPEDFSAEIVDIYTKATSRAFTSYPEIKNFINNIPNQPFPIISNFQLPVVGPQPLLITLNTLAPNAAFAVPAEDVNGINPIYSTLNLNPTGTGYQSVTDNNGMPLLLIGDEQFTMGMHYRLNAICSTYTVPRTLTNSDISAFVPNVNAMCSSSSTNQEISAMPTAVLNTLAVPDDLDFQGYLLKPTTQPNPVYHYSGNKVGYKVAIRVGREVPNVLLYFNADDIPPGMKFSRASIGLSPISLRAREVTHASDQWWVIDGGTIISNAGYTFVFYIWFEYENCSPIIPLNNNPSNPVDDYSLTLYYDWNCDDVYSSADPVFAAANCAITQSVLIDVTPHPIVIETSSEIASPTSCTNCEQIVPCDDNERTLKVTLENLELGGIGQLKAIFYLPEDIELQTTQVGVNTTFDIFINVPNRTWIGNCRVNFNRISVTNTNGVNRYVVDLTDNTLFIDRSSSPDCPSAFETNSNYTNPANSSNQIQSKLVYSQLGIANYETWNGLLLNKLILSLNVKVKPNTCTNHVAAPTYQFEYNNYCNLTDKVLTIPEPFEGVENGFFIDQAQSTCVLVSTVAPNAGCGGTIPSITVDVHADAMQNVAYTWSDNGTVLSTPGGNLATGRHTITNPSSPTTGHKYTLVVTEGSGNGCVQERSILVGGLAVDVDVTNSCASSSAEVVAPTGGGYSYDWSTPATTAAVSGLATGNSYTVTVTETSTSCSGTATITTASVNPGFTIKSTDSGCLPANSGTAEVIDVTDAVAPFTYAWSSSLPATAAQEDLAAGTYYVTVTDAVGCSATSSVTIAQESTSVTIASATGPSCNNGSIGSNNGQITTTVSGSHSFYWSNGTNSSTASSLPAGTYNVTATSIPGGCTATASTTLTEPAAIGVSLTATNLFCSTGVLGTITTSVSNSVGNLTYYWSGNSINSSNEHNANLTGLMPGVYFVTVTDANGCGVIGRAEVESVGTLPTIDLVGTNLICYGDNSGIVTVGNPISNFNYTWSIMQLPSTSITNLAAGAYSVTASNSNGCTGTASITITQPAQLSVILDPTDIDCDMGTLGSIDATASGGTSPYTYAWSPTGHGTSASIGSLAVGLYTITVTDDNYCTASAGANIDAPWGVVLDIDATDPSCGGIADGSITVTPSPTGSYNYTWSNSAITSNIIGLSAGTYKITVSNTIGCEVTASASLTELLPVSISLSTSNVMCASGALGTIAAQASGGTEDYTYTWSPSTYSGDYLTGLSVGTYDVTATDDDGCSATASAILTENGTPTALLLEAVLPTCNGQNDGEIEIVNYTGNYVYTWSNSQTGHSIAGLTAGIYDVSASLGGVCTTTESFVLGEPADIKVRLSTTNVDCGVPSLGSITAIVTDGVSPYTYSWSHGSTTTATVNNLLVGNYEVTVTDANGCTTVANVDVAVTNSFALNVDVTTVHCDDGDGAIDITPVGGTAPYTYIWNTTETTASISDLDPGIYSVTVTDDGGCQAVEHVQVASDKKPILLESTSTAPTCGNADGSVDLTVWGNNNTYTYQWSYWGTPVATTQDLTNVTSGLYTVEVTDADGCITETNVALSDDNISMAFSITNPSCGASDGEVQAVITGGTSPFTVNWYPSYSSGNPLTNVSAQFILAAAIDDNLCVAVHSEIVDNAVIGLAVQTQNITCNAGGAIDLTITGGTGPYTIMWSNGATTEDLTGLTFGNYSVTVFDANGCANALEDITVHHSTFINPVLVSSITPTSTACGLSLGAVDITVTGGQAPYGYLWSKVGDGTFTASTQNLVNLSAGTYEVTITEASGCTVSSNVEVYNTFELDVDVTLVHCDDGDGEIDLTPLGGVSPYTYLWNTTETSSSISNLDPGVYSVTVTDDGGCLAIKSIYVASDKKPILLETSSTAPTCGNADGSIDLTVWGYNGPYTYQWDRWSSTFTTDEDIPFAPSGLYSLQVTDADGCVTETNVALSDDNMSMAFSVTNPTCGAADGEVLAVITGGTAPYNVNWYPYYTWVNPLTNVHAQLIIAGAVDDNMCIAVHSEVIDNGVIGLSVLTQNATCNAGGEIELTISGGTAPYTIMWSNGENTETITDLEFGNYDVTVVDASGCANALLDITVHHSSFLNPLNITALSPTPNTCGQSLGAVNLTVTGGQTPYTYQWSKVADGTFSSSNQNLSTLKGGLYLVTVTDANGCSVSEGAFVEDDSDIEWSVSTVWDDCPAASPSVGSATFTATGGTAPYSYDWLWTGWTGATQTGLASAYYPVLITDDNDCVSLAEALIGNDYGLAVSADILAAGCGNLGSIDITLSGATGPFDFQWSNGATTEDVSNLPAGTYYVIITNSQNCNHVEANMVVHDLDDIGLIAAFSASTLIPTTVDEVEFTNNTVGSANFEWQIDDAYAASTQDFAYTFTTSGTYSVKLIVEYGSCKDSIIEEVVVSALLKTTDNDLQDGSMADVAASTFIKIYPNPTTGLVTIAFDNALVAKKAKISVLNVAGQVVDEFETTIPSDGKVVSNIFGLSEGVYIFKVTSQENQLIQRIILIR